jgi:hypothetical protein
LETSTTNKFPSCQVSLWSFFLYRSSEHWCHFMLSVRLVRVNIEMPSNFLSHCIDTNYKQKRIHNMRNICCSTSTGLPFSSAAK